jgi:uncharacterized membrane protein (DUF373 family)
MNEPESKAVSSILKWSSVGKRIVAGVLMAMMFLLVGLVTLEIVYAFISVALPGDNPTASEIVMSEQDMLAVLGLFLTVLIALELIETVEVYFKKHSIHVEIVVLVAIIALARKVIILDLNKYDPPVLFALGLLILALGATYFFVRKAAPDEE